MADGKRPDAIARSYGAPLAFAGLWEDLRDPAGETFRTLTIVTTSANDDMAQLHDRMPVILEPDDCPLWLGGSRATMRRCSGRRCRAHYACGQSAGR